jgi:hypothetical protein
MAAHHYFGGRHQVQDKEVTATEMLLEMLLKETGRVSMGCKVKFVDVPEWAVVRSHWKITHFCGDPAEESPFSSPDQYRVIDLEPVRFCKCGEDTEGFLWMGSCCDCKEVFVCVRGRTIPKSPLTIMGGCVKS